MKRWIYYLIAVAVAALFVSTPFHGTDIAKLAPVEVIWLSETEGEVYLETDTGDSGRGESVQAALENMKESVPGTFFLETADYLVLNRDDAKQTKQISALLRPTCMICVASEIPDMEKVAAFLSAHEPGLTLREYEIDQDTIPILMQKDGRFFWVGE